MSSVPFGTAFRFREEGACASTSDAGFLLRFAEVFCFEEVAFDLAEPLLESEIHKFSTQRAAYLSLAPSPFVTSLRWG